MSNQNTGLLGPLRPLKYSEVASVLKVIHEKGGVFKYSQVFQCDNRPEFKSDVTKLPEKHNVDIIKTTTKYKLTHTAFVEVFNKLLAKQLLKSMNAQKLHNPEKVSAIWVENLKAIISQNFWGYSTSRTNCKVSR